MKVVGTMQQPLYSFYDRYVNRKTLFLPLHQQRRGDAWSKSKKEAWFKRIRNGGQLPSTITTYTIRNDENEIVYINDGANRVIHSLLAFVIGNQEIDWKYMLESASIVEQSVIYESKDEAIDHYIDINTKGCMATPYEILQCKFVAALEDFDLLWKDPLDSINTIVRKHLVTFAVENGQNRQKIHKHRRDSMALFYRFTSADKSKWNPNVSNNILSDDPRQLKKQVDVEEKLLSLFQELGCTEIKLKLEKFDNFLKDRTQLFKQIWKETGHVDGQRVADTVARWYFTVAIYHANNDYTIECLREFIKGYCERYHGKTTMIYKTEEGFMNTNATLSKPPGLVEFKAVGMEDFEKKKKRLKPSIQLAEGLNHSHILGMSHNPDNQEFLIENALENRHRSNRDMTDEEFDRLSSLG